MVFLSQKKDLTQLHEKTLTEEWGGPGAVQMTSTHPQGSPPSVDIVTSAGNGAGRDAALQGSLGKDLVSSAETGKYGSRGDCWAAKILIQQLVNAIEYIFNHAAGLEFAGWTYSQTVNTNWAASIYIFSCRCIFSSSVKT